MMSCAMRCIKGCEAKSSECFDPDVSFVEVTSVQCIEVDVTAWFFYLHNNYDNEDIKNERMIHKLF